MIFTIPEAPTANTYYRSVATKRGVKVLLSKAGREYKEAVEASVLQQMANAGRSLRSVKVDGPAVFYMWWHRGIRSGDLDNRIKSCQDSLKGLLFNDDAQVVAIHAHRFDSPRNGRMVVSVVPFVATSPHNAVNGPHVND